MRTLTCCAAWPRISQGSQPCTSHMRENGNAPPSMSPFPASLFVTQHEDTCPSCNHGTCPQRVAIGSASGPCEEAIQLTDCSPRVSRRLAIWKPVRRTNCSLVAHHIAAAVPGILPHVKDHARLILSRCLGPSFSTSCRQPQAKRPTAMQQA